MRVARGPRIYSVSRAPLMKRSVLWALAVLLAVVLAVVVCYGRYHRLPMQRREGIFPLPAGRLDTLAEGQRLPLQQAGKGAEKEEARDSAATSSTPLRSSQQKLKGPPRWVQDANATAGEKEAHEPFTKEEETVEPLNWTAPVAKSLAHLLLPATSSPTPLLLPSPSMGTRYSYMLTRSYGGQLTRAIKNLMMQQCWAHSLTPAAVLVEPFSSKSLLLHTPSLWREAKAGKLVEAARFSDYFDLQFYNQASAGRKGAGLVMWEEFLASAPRKVAVVYTPRSACASELRRSADRPVDKAFKTFLKGLSELGFVVVKEVDVDCGDSERGRVLMQAVLPLLHNTTIVFGSWRNYHVVDSWLAIGTQCDTSDKNPAPLLRPSLRLQQHMLNYRSNILHANKTIAIMLRVERFLTLKSSGRSSETLESCLTKTQQLYAELRQQAQWTDSQPYLTLDIGQFGSGIMQSSSLVSRFGESLDRVTHLVTKLLVNVYNGRWKTIEEWEKSFVEATEGVVERGYVAMMQRGIAVESDCLILMGGGSYQEVAARQYLEAHPNPSEQCLHTFCAATSLTKSLAQARGERERRTHTERHT